MELKSHTQACGYTDLQNGGFQCVVCSTALGQKVTLYWAYNKRVKNNFIFYSVNQQIHKHKLLYSFH
jgi:hypothetical protein